LFAAAVKRPVANSLATDVYRLMPNYTDVNSFSERGWLTLNLAPIGNETRYHSPGDEIAALDPATLQHMGDQTLALTRALANGPPPTSRGDRIFMDVAGRWLITLPLIAGAILLVGLLAAFALISLRRGGTALGLTIAAGTMVASAAVAFLLLAAMGLVRPGMFWRANPVWTHLTAYASVMLVAVVALNLVGTRLERRQLRPAFWLFYLLLGALIGLVAPGGMIFFILPPAIALIGMAAARRWWPAEPIGAILAIVALYLTWGAMLGMLEELLNTGPMWLFAPLGTLLILPALIEAVPLIRSAGLRAGAALAGGLAIATWAAAAAAPAYSADREQRFVIQHVTDASSGKAWWSVVNDGAPLPPALGSLMYWKRNKLPISERPRWLAAAPPDRATKAPAAQLVSQMRNGNERTLTIRLVANGATHVSLIAPEDAKLRSTGVAGFVRPMNPKENGKYFIDCFGRSCDGATLQLTIDQWKPVEFLLVGSGRALPSTAAALLRARPQFARPQYAADDSIVFAKVKL
jgi:Peptidase family M28